MKKETKYSIIKTNEKCKNCGKILVRTNGRWKHEGFENKLFICGNPQSKIRWKVEVSR